MLAALKRSGFFGRGFLALPMYWCRFGLLVCGSKEYDPGSRSQRPVLSNDFMALVSLAGTL